MAEIDGLADEGHVQTLEAPISDVPGHLGGYIPGGDPATFYPDLWSWLVKGPLAIKSVLDVGCGEGLAMQVFKSLGLDRVVGIEGVEQSNPDIVKWDFTQGPVHLEGSFDLVWACEFVEHLDEHYIRNLLPTFHKGKLVLMTHAFPGQQGYHHVNCRTEDYWLGFMLGAGFDYSPGLTFKTREIAAKNEDPYNHYLRSGLAFRRA